VTDAAATWAPPTTITHLATPQAGPHAVWGRLRDAYRGVMVDKFEDLRTKGNDMAEYDRRWRPGCSWNYVDAHNEIWEAVQHEPGRFTPRDVRQFPS